jgi:hypothetical protein
MRCDAQTLRCVPGVPLDASGGADATHPIQPDSMPDSSDVGVGDVPPRDDGLAGDAPEDVPDVTPDVQMCSGSIGCSCSLSTDCTTGVCAGGDTLTPALLKALGNNIVSVCTQPCCTSSDCPDGAVCFGTGGGGNYCVPPKWIGRTSGVGGSQGGAACSGGADCKSGLCNMGTCADTCCSTAQQGSECAAGTFCRFAQFPGNSFDTHVIAWCGPTIGTMASGTSCAVDISCQSGKCNAARCQAVCRSSSDCGSGFACSYGLAPTLPTNKDIIDGCMQPTGNIPPGANCSSNSDCTSAFCDGMHCTNTCATDSDCKTGMRCRPVLVQVQGLYSVLACES